MRIVSCGAVPLPGSSVGSALAPSVAVVSTGVSMAGRVTVTVVPMPASE